MDRLPEPHHEKPVEVWGQTRAQWQARRAARLGVNSTIVAACSAGTTSNAAPADTAKLDGGGEQPATPLAEAPFAVREIARFERE